MVVLAVLGAVFATASLLKGDRDRASTGASPTGKNGSGNKGRKPGTKLGHYQNITMSKGYAVSFTDDPKHPTKENNRGGDLYYRFADYLESDHSIAALPPGQAGTYAACRDNTRYAERLPEKMLTAGRVVCVTTDSGLTSVVKITRKGTEPTWYFTFDLTVYQGVRRPSGD